jgi:hypothetical protein
MVVLPSKMLKWYDTSTYNTTTTTTSQRNCRSCGFCYKSVSRDERKGA